MREADDQFSVCVVAYIFNVMEMAGRNEEHLASMNHFNTGKFCDVTQMILPDK